MYMTRERPNISWLLPVTFKTVQFEMYLAMSFIKDTYPMNEEVFLIMIIFGLRMNVLKTAIFLLNSLLTCASANEMGQSRRI